MTADQATAITVPVGTATEPPRLTGPQLLTDALIDAVANGHCGWSRKQIKILGAPWPLVAGWREKIVAEGRTLTGEEVAALYDARKKPKRPAEADPAEITELPCPWCGVMVQRIEQGGNRKEFCNKRHKAAFNNTLTTAAIEFSRLLRVPSALQAWSLARVNPSQNTKSDLGGTPLSDALSPTPGDES